MPRHKPYRHPKTGRYSRPPPDPRVQELFPMNEREKDELERQRILDQAIAAQRKGCDASPARPPVGEAFPGYKYRDSVAVLRLVCDINGRQTMIEIPIDQVKELSYGNLTISATATSPSSDRCPGRGLTISDRCPGRGALRPDRSTTWRDDV